jgi:two-component system response regulator HydG
MTKPSTPSILIADDDPQFLRIMEHHIRGWSYRVDCVTDKGQMLRHLAHQRPDLMLMDIRFGEHDGIEVLRQVLADHDGLRVAMLTAFGSIDNAIAAIKIGAIDYLTKPIDLNRLRAVVSLAQDPVPSKKGAGSKPSPSTSSATSHRPILGEGAATRDLRSLIGRVAETDATVLILGESGTGKELVARAIHDQSPRRSGPFVPLNMAALPRELVESTLFGHAKGAFTGADQNQNGCCEAADGGTLFLDEIGEMEIGLQSKLLRFLQERSFQRVGQSQTVNVNVRIVAATNRDPLEQVRLGLLRLDLYYRLNVFPIRVPTLRERADDIPMLATHFLNRTASRRNRSIVGFVPEALPEVMKHDWPGNIRELENMVERLAILGEGDEIGPEEVRAMLGGIPGRDRRRVAEIPLASHEDDLKPIDRIEKEALVESLAASNGNVREAAERLGMSLATAYRKIKKYKID